MLEEESGIEPACAAIVLELMTPVRIFRRLTHIAVRHTAFNIDTDQQTGVTTAAESTDRRR